MELTNNKRNEIAEEIAEFWKNNCFDEEFYEQCRDNLDEILEYEYDLQGEDFDREYNIIMDLIDNKYAKDNWQLIEVIETLFTHDSFIVQNQHIVINNMIFHNVWKIEINNNTMTLYDSDDCIISEISCNMVKEIKINESI